MRRSTEVTTPVELGPAGAVAINNMLIPSKDGMVFIQIFEVCQKGSAEFAVLYIVIRRAGLKPSAFQSD